MFGWKGGRDPIPPTPVSGVFGLRPSQYVAKGAAPRRTFAHLGKCFNAGATM
jgi:hypothetical protein